MNIILFIIDVQKKHRHTYLKETDSPGGMIAYHHLNACKEDKALHPDLILFVFQPFHSI